MEEETRNKFIGIFIAVAMFGSLIAAGFIYADPDAITTNNANPNDILDRQISTQNFEINFDSSVLKELNSVRIAASTNETNKNNIDISVRSIENVSRISSSQFVKQGEGWYYFAEIELERDSSINEVLNEIFSLSYFTGEIEESLKRVTIETPESTTLYNSDLNLERNFIFNFETTVALASVNTLPRDEISVSGEIQLRGNEIVSLNLVESSNPNLEGTNYTLEETLTINELGEELFIEGLFDSNIDQNYYQNELGLIDSSAQVFFFENDNNQVNFFGQSTISNAESISNLFSESLTLSLTRPAIFELSEVFIEDLNQTITLDSNTFSTQVLFGKNVGEEVDLELTISISRSSAQVTNATSK